MINYPDNCLLKITVASLAGGYKETASKADIVQE